MEIRLGHYLSPTLAREKPEDYVLDFVSPYNMADDITEKPRSYYQSIVLQNKIHHRAITTSATDWKQPEKNWVCINTDDAVAKNKVAGCIGITRNCVGKWLGGFSKIVGICNVTIAIMGCYGRIKTCPTQRIEIQIDSQEVVNMLFMGKKMSM